MTLVIAECKCGWREESRVRLPEAVGKTHRYLEAVAAAHEAQFLARRAYRHEAEVRDEVMT